MNMVTTTSNQEKRGEGEDMKMKGNENIYVCKKKWCKRVVKSSSMNMNDRIDNNKRMIEKTNILEWVVLKGEEKQKHHRFILRNKL